MESNSIDVVLKRTRGVLAERFGVEIAMADAILSDVARLQGQSVGDLAAAVVRSCTDGSTPLPRRLYMDSDEVSAAA